RPAFVSPGDGPMLLVYSTDGRLRHEVEFTPELTRKYWAHSGTPGNPDGSFNEDLQIAALVPAAKPAAVDPATSPAALENGASAPVHADEAADVARMRNHRVQANGKAYR